MRDSHRDGGYIKYKTIKIYMSLLVNLKIRPQGSTVRLGVGTIIFDVLAFKNVQGPHVVP